MKTIQLTTLSKPSKILIGESLSHLDQYLPDKKVVIITDSNILRLYREKLPDAPMIVIESSEDHKTMKTVEMIYGELMNMGIDRSSFIIGIGGGIVCDITGFVASTYLRGIPFAFVSTSLLSQVDASTGGKNGVNFSGYKNMIGCFNQPDFVICDLDMLKTLPPKELSNGFAEIIKSALIANRKLFTTLEDHVEKALALDPHIMEILIYDSLTVKTKIVRKDEHETGERKKLNFGHTIGHALEKIDHIPHGHAISLGMIAALQLSCRKNYLSDEDVRPIRHLLTALKLPVDLKIKPSLIMDAIRKDKKRDGYYLHFIFIKKIGDAVIEKMDMNELEELIHDLC